MGSDAGAIDEGSESAIVTSTFVVPAVGDAYVVHSFECVEELNRPYRATVRLIAAEEAIDALDLIGKEARLTLRRGGGQARHFHGLVDQIVLPDQQDVTERRLVVEVCLVPALWALAYTRDTRIFQDKTSLQVVEQVLREVLEPQRREVDVRGVDASRLVVRDYCVQYQESKLDFVHRLLEEDGIGYRFEQPGPERLVLFDDNRHLPEAPTSQRPVPYAMFSSGHHDMEPVTELVPTVRRGPTTLTMRDLDWTRAFGPVLETSTPVGDSAQAREVYEHGIDRHQVIHEDAAMLGSLVASVVASLLPSGLPNITDRVINLPGAVLNQFTSSSLIDRARIGAQALQRDARTFGGASLAIGFAPGMRFELVGHPALGSDGEYLLTRVTHSGGALSEARPHAEVYSNRFECLPFATPWRPKRATPKPRIHGVQTAVVVGPMGMDVHTDQHGRVKLRFPWDRGAETLSGNYTCWVRASQAWAGQGSPAFLFIPRVGMEVVVSFIDGDPDRPLVTGCVYNGQSPTPALLPVQATKSMIRTRSIPHGTGYNELSFEDALGRERVHLRAERDLEELVLNDHVTTVLRSQANRVQVDHLEEVGEDQELRVHGSRTVMVARNQREIVGGDRVDSVDGTDHHRVGGDYFLDVNQGPCVVTVQEGEYAVHARGPMLLRQNDERFIELTSEGEQPAIVIHSKGAQVKVAEHEIELTVGESKIQITSAMIRVNGKVFPSSTG